MQTKWKARIIGWLCVMILTIPVHAWSNGGYSTDPNNPVQGTHDIILEKAIDMLPSEMQAKINITVASYGTELPDCKTGIYCIGDTTKHHIYYHANGSLQDDVSAVRAWEEYDLAKSYLAAKDTYNFSLHLGAMSHYISDTAVFGHTMGASTDWGTEVHHDDYESYVDNHPDYFFSNVIFDGNYENLSAYDAALKLANETTFDEGIYTNIWMDSNYNWSNPAYKAVTQTRLNYTVNLLAEVLRTLIRGDKEVQVMNPSSNPSVILNDDDRSRSPGTNITRLNVTVTGDVGSVTINLSPIGGSTVALMKRISGTDIYTITTNATTGINLTNNLVVNATDTSGNFNNSVFIPLSVLLRGDIVRDNKIDLKDLLYLRKYLANQSLPIGNLVDDIYPAEGDGKVDLKDLLFLRKYLAGLEPVI